MGAAQLVLEFANGALDRPRRFPPRPANGVEGADRVEDGAPDLQDRVGLEGGRGVGTVGVDGTQQTEHAGLHRVLVVEEPRHGNAEPSDHVFHQMGVAGHEWRG